MIQVGKGVKCFKSDRRFDSIQVAHHLADPLGPLQHPRVQTRGSGRASWKNPWKFFGSQGQGGTMNHLRTCHHFYTSRVLHLISRADQPGDSEAGRLLSPRTKTWQRNHSWWFQRRLGIFSPCKKKGGKWAPIFDLRIVHFLYNGWRQPHQLEKMDHFLEPRQNPLLVGFSGTFHLYITSWKERKFSLSQRNPPNNPAYFFPAGDGLVNYCNIHM